jgi:hypothetical protein
MRTLTRSAVFLSMAFLLVGGFAFAEAPSAKISTSLSSESGDAGLTTQSSASATSTTVSVDASTGSYFRKSTVRLGYDQINPDYGRYLLTDRSGNITPLSNTYSATESVARAAVDYYIKDVTLSIDGAQTASTTPFTGYTAKFTAAYTNYLLGAKYAVAVSRADHDLPLSYFVNPDTFQTELRPSRNLEDRVALSWEQILNEKSKTKLEIFSAERPESRPPCMGGEASIGYALTDYSALLGKIGIAHESRGAILYDDRGYFDATWAQIEYRIEPSYRWTLSAIFDTILESETARGIYPDQSIGTDSIAIQARTRGKGWELGLKTLGSLANTGYESLQFGVDLAWQI